AKQEAVCSQCGMACSVDLNIQNGKIRRVTAPVSDHGNIGNLCARGRFGSRAYEKSARATQPQINTDGQRKDVSWPDALSYCAEKLAYVSKKYGPESIAVLSSDCLTTEEALSYRAFLRSELGIEKIGSQTAAGYRQVLSGLLETHGASCKIGSLADLKASDIVIVAGGGAAEFHPVLKTLLNSFIRKEERELIVISPWPDFCWEKATLPIYVNPEYYDKFLLEFCQSLEGKSADGSCDISQFGVPAATFAKLVSLIHSGREITLLVVPQLFGGSAALVRLTSILHHFVKTVIPLGASVNSRGAVTRAEFFTARKAEASNDSGNENVLQKIKNGNIKALYLLGDDPLEYSANPQEIEILFSKLELIIHQSPYLTRSAKFAHAVLPSAVLPEKTGSIIDMWGEEHIIKAALLPPPGVKTDADILFQLQNLWKNNSAVVKNVPANEIISSALLPPARLQYDRKQFPFMMTAVPSIYGDGIISRQSPEMQKLKGSLKIVMNADDCEKAGIADDASVHICTPYGEAKGIAKLSVQVRPGNILVENIPGNAEGLRLISEQVSAVPANIRLAGGES
ncbi:MAG TPA: molybdopterin-dependent oxidoreductase, partial [Smithellaceae bacterium]|nr:molybdopterin-dependent oxidoreductase [Smithellaceae bacterium]